MIQCYDVTFSLHCLLRRFSPYIYLVNRTNIYPSASARKWQAYVTEVRQSNVSNVQSGNRSDIQGKYSLLSMNKSVKYPGVWYPYAIVPPLENKARHIQLSWYI